MAQTPKTKLKAAQKTAVLESLRDLTGDVADSVKKDLIGETSKDFIRELLGIAIPEKKISGTLTAGEDLELDRVLNDKEGENRKLRQQLILEKQLREQEKSRTEKKQQELRLAVHAIQEETKQLAQATSGLSQEVEIAAIQAPANPGVYHVVFFEKLIEFIASFRKKIENASVWLAAYNTRARKLQTFWGQVGISGAKRLLSPEDYAQRSAG